VLRCLASSVLNVVRQVGRQTSLVNFLKIQYLEFGSYLFVLNDILIGFGGTKSNL